MASQGPLIVGTGTDAGGGHNAWSNPSRITANDGSFATSLLSFGGSPDALSNNLQGTMSGNVFSIPNGSTILGIQVDIFEERIAGSVNGIKDSSVKIIKGGTVGGTEHATNINWLDAGSLQSYGGASDLWGLSWASSDINASNFGCQLVASAFDTSSSATAGVDYMQITVTYTPPPAAGVSVSGIKIF